MTRAPNAWIAGLLAILVAGCGDDKPEAETIRRDRGDRPPVVFVDRPAPSSIASFKRETEPNNVSSEAGILELPGGVSGSLDGESDVDLFAVVPPNDGILSVRVSGIAGVDLMVDLRDETNKSLARSDRGPAETAEGLPNFAVKKGVRYVVAVAEFVKKRKTNRRKPDGENVNEGRTGPSPVYSLAVKMVTPKSDEETEPNFDPASAPIVLLGQTWRGYVGWNGDVDAWRLSLDGFTSNYALEVFVEGVDGVSYALTMTDDKGNEILSRDGTKSGSVFVKNLLPVLGSPFYVVKLAGKRSNPEQAYSLKMTARALDDDEEREPNDTAERATELVAEGESTKQGVVRGFLSPGDVDYFVIRPPGSVLLDAKVLPPRGLDVAVSIRAGGLTETADDRKNAEPEELTGIRVEGGKLAYVVIKGSFEGGEPEPYELRWSTAAAAAPSPLTPDLSGFDE